MNKDIVFSPQNLSALLIDRKPCAHASLFGGNEKGQIQGTVSLYATPLGVLVKADFGGLPKSEKTHSYRVLFGGKRHSTALPCAPGGSCQCLTASFAVEDVLGGKVALLADDNERPVATGELRSVGF